MMIVDEVSVVLEISAEEIKQAPLLVILFSSDFIPGMAKTEFRRGLPDRKWQQLQ